jgi:hypothetical protein
MAEKYDKVIYLICYGEWSDYTVLQAFTKKTDAENFIKKYGEDYYIEEVPLDLSERL